MDQYSGCGILLSCRIQGHDVRGLGKDDICLCDISAAGAFRCRLSLTAACRRGRCRLRMLSAPSLLRQRLPSISLLFFFSFTCPPSNYFCFVRVLLVIVECKYLLYPYIHSFLNFMIKGYHFLTFLSIKFSFLRIFCLICLFYLVSAIL